MYMHAFTDQKAASSMLSRCYSLAKLPGNFPERNDILSVSQACEPYNPDAWVAFMNIELGNKLRQRPLHDLHIISLA